MVAFVLYELRVENPLIRVRIFEDRAFAADNAILFLLMIPFVPLFFFASMYAQISLGESASETGLYLLIFFVGFATASQWGGRMLDRAGARPSVVLGCAVAAVGFALWAHSLPDLSVSSQWYYIVIAGAGVGLVLAPANTDALNRVPASRYGEATGITQTVRNFGSSLGMAVLGTILILENKSNIEATATAQGVPKAAADELADAISQGNGAGEAPAHAGGALGKVVASIPHDFALATQTVFYAMAGVMALAFVVAVATMPAGKVEQVPEDPAAAYVGWVIARSRRRGTRPRRSRPAPPPRRRGGQVPGPAPGRRATRRSRCCANDRTRPVKPRPSSTSRPACGPCSATRGSS